MKALTLYQPWATLVAIGAKRIETRSWYTNYRGPLAIHVSKNKKLDHFMCLEEPFKSALEGTLIKTGPSSMFANGIQYQFVTANLHLGCVIAICRLTGCYSTAELLGSQVGEVFLPRPSGVNWHISKKELAFGDYSPGRFLWFLEDVKLLPEPIPAKGMMGLWEWNNKESE